MAKYRKRQMEIEAVQYTEYGKLVKGMCNSQSCFVLGNNKPHVHIIHNNQIVLLEVGDYIIQELDGEHYYPCKPDIFEKTYEKSKSIIETLLDVKKIELLVNGVRSKYWIVPITEDQLDEIKNCMDFIKEISDPELEKLKEEIKPAGIVKKGGYVFLLKSLMSDFTTYKTK